MTHNIKTQKQILEAENLQLKQEVAALREKVKGLEEEIKRFKNNRRDMDELLNRGEGVYRH